MEEILIDYSEWYRLEIHFTETNINNRMFVFYFRSMDDLFTYAHYIGRYPGLASHFYLSSRDDVYFEITEFIHMDKVHVYCTYPSSEPGKAAYISPWEARKDDLDFELGWIPYDIHIFQPGRGTKEVYNLKDNLNYLPTHIRNDSSQAIKKLVAYELVPRFVHLMYIFGNDRLHEHDNPERVQGIYYHTRSGVKKFPVSGENWLQEYLQCDGYIQKKSLLKILKQFIEDYN